MRISALSRNSIRAAFLVLQEVQRQPALPDALRVAAEAACIGYPSLTMIRLELWAFRSEYVEAWAAALVRTRKVLDRLLEIDADVDIRDLARWANRHFPTEAELAGHRVVEDPNRGWTLELAS